MRKFLMLGVLVLSIIFIGTIFVVNRDNKTNDTYALSAKYNNIDELIGNSHLVVSVIISNKPELIEYPSGKQVLRGKTYEAQVKEVLYDELKFNFNKNDIIKVVQANEVQTLDGEWVEFSKMTEMKPGKYLLFLNSLQSSEGLIFLNNSPNHLYELDGKEYKSNSSENKYKNIADNTDDTLEELEQVNIEKVINDNEKK